MAAEAHWGRLQAQTQAIVPDLDARRSLWLRPDALTAGCTGAVLLLTAYYFLLTRVGSLHMVLSATSSRPFYFPLVMLLVAVACGLFGANFAVLNLLMLQRRRSALPLWSLSGASVGAFAAGCPACGALLLSVVGVGSGLSILPFAGLELWSLGNLIMGVTLWRSVRRLRRAACAVETPGCSDPQRLSATHVGMLAVLGVAALVLLSMLLVSTG